MQYDGEERRKPTVAAEVAIVHCIHEHDWGKLTATVENLDRRINGSLHEMEKHMIAGEGWRKALFGIVIAIFLQIITFAYLWGGMTVQVEGHDKRLCAIETLELEAQKIRATNVAKITRLERAVDDGSHKI